MNVEISNVEKMVISDAPGIDPVTVIFTDDRPGRGAVIIACFGEAWSAGWNAMGEDRDVKRFFLQASEDYLVERLHNNYGNRKRLPYLAKIVRAIQEALKAQQ